MTLKIDSKHLPSLATINTVSSIKRNFKNCLCTALPSTCSLSLPALYVITLLSKNMQWSKDSCLDLSEVLDYSEVGRGSFTLTGTFHLRRGKNHYFDGEPLSLLRPMKMLSSAEQKADPEYSGHCQWVWKISYFDTYRSINWKKLMLDLTLGRDTALLRKD